MPKKLLSKLFPNAEAIQKIESLRVLKPLFRNSNLWHLNRRSVPRAFLIGLFCASLPLPFQMIIAAFLAYHINANLPISVALVWLSNPITMPPYFFSAYQLGSWMLGRTTMSMSEGFSLEWFMTEIHTIWMPLWIGCLTIGIILGLISFFSIHIAWRTHVASNWQRRKRNRAALQVSNND